MTKRDKVLEALKASLVPLDDDEIAKRAGFAQRQAANSICRALADQGVLVREPGPSGKIVNRLVGREPNSPVDQGAGSVEARNLAEPAGSSRVQRDAERHMLAALSASLGVELAPRRLVHPTGARVELDGADDRLSVLVECWAHQGTAKVAQKYKLVNDAVKLAWIAKSLNPPPSRLIICVSDEAAVRHLRGTSWQGSAIRDLGVELAVVELGADVVAEIVAAQRRQFR